MGGVHGAILAFVIFGAVVMPLLLLVFTLQAFRRGLRRQEGNRMGSPFAVMPKSSRLLVAPALA